MSESTLWSRLVESIVREHPHAVVESESALRFVLVTGGAQPVRVGIRVRAQRVHDQAVGAIAADLGPAHRLDPAAALELNAMLVHGALVSEAGVLYLRSLVALDETVLSRFGDTVRLLAVEASQLKRRLGAQQAVVTRASSTTFAHFSD